MANEANANIEALKQALTVDQQKAALDKLGATYDRKAKEAALVSALDALGQTPESVLALLTEAVPAEPEDAAEPKREAPAAAEPAADTPVPAVTLEAFETLERNVRSLAEQFADLKRSVLDLSQRAAVEVDGAAVEALTRRVDLLAQHTGIARK